MGPHLRGREMKARILEARNLPDESAARWRAIIAANDRLDSPFFAPEFTKAVGAAREDAFVAEISENGEPRAFLPFHLCRGGVAKPIGGHLSDYHGLIADRDFAPPAEELLAACNLSAYDFNHAPADQPVLADGAVVRSVSPRIDLSDGAEVWRARLSKSGRHAVKDTQRRMRKLAREHAEVRFVYNDRREETWRSLVEMKNAALGQNQPGGAPSIDAGWVGEVFRTLRAIDAPAFGGALSAVFAGERLIAAHFGLRSDRTWCWWFNTYDPAFAGFAPGLITILEAVEIAPKKGLQAIDFGRGAQSYKTRLATDERALCEGSIARRRTHAGRLRAVQKTALRLADAAPLGRLDGYPQRALTRLVSAVRLPETPAAASAVRTGATPAPTGGKP